MVDVKTLKAVGGVIYREVNGRKMRKPEIIKALLNEKSVSKTFAITQKNDDNDDFKTHTQLFDICYRHKDDSFHFTPFDGDLDVLVYLKDVVYVVEVEILVCS